MGFFFLILVVSGFLLWVLDFCLGEGRWSGGCKAKTAETLQSIITEEKNRKEIPKKTEEMQ